MKVKPMIFNTEMVKAILAGKKTVTRRPAKIDYERGMNGPVIRGNNGEVSVLSFAPVARLCPFGNVGDLIYVRETWREFSNTDECGCLDHCLCPSNGTPLYFATHDDGESKWKPSIHMPRKHSRLTLKVTDVRIEKVQDITPSEAIKEGFNDWTGFAFTWSSIYLNQGFGWDDNPYVWVIEFEVIHKNVDKYLSEKSS